MTSDELACTCLQKRGRDVVLQCASARGQGAEAGVSCLPEDSLCDASPDACCGDLTCLRGSDESGKPKLGLCKKACTADSECPNNCCAELPSVAGKFCAERSFCVGSCRKQYEECDENRNPCCDGLVCTASGSDPFITGCQVPCTMDSQCSTGCCVLFQKPGGGTRDDGICAPKDRCPSK